MANLGYIVEGKKMQTAGEKQRGQRKKRRERREEARLMTTEEIWKIEENRVWGKGNGK